MKALSVALFAATFILMIALPKRRTLVAVCSAAVFMVSGILPLGAVIGYLDFNVLLILAGTMGLVALFIESKMPNRLADILLGRSKNTVAAVVMVSLFAGFISAFVDNVATVLMIAPVGLAVAKKLEISPVAMLICISVSSNLQGAATLVGDTTSIMLGSYAGMDFSDFFVLEGRPGIFWAVEIGALVTIPVTMFLFRKDRRPVSHGELTPVTDFFPTALLLANIALLVCASFLPNKPGITNGLICAGLFIIGLIRVLIKDRRPARVKEAFTKIDYRTILLLAALFLVIGGINEAGVIADISGFFASIGGQNLFLLYTVIVWGSVAVSAFVDNIPYVATMLPVISSVALMMDCPPYLLYFGLLSGATLGGNLTPIGASANITAIGILRKEGYEVKTRDFLRIGVPFTLCAVMAGYLFCWFVWK